MISLKNLFRGFPSKIFLRKEALVLVLSLPIFVFAAGNISATRAADNARTNLLFNYGSELYNIKTQKGDVLGALSERGINLYPQDELSVAADTKLYGQSLYFSIKKSWPVIIYDDNKKIEARASSPDPLKVLVQNNIKVWPEDIISDELILDPVSFGGAGHLIRIKRAPVFFVEADGTTLEVRNWDNKVASILARTKIPINSKDIIKPIQESSLTPGEKIEITRINEENIEINEAISFDTVDRTDSSVPFGQRLVTQAGVNGVLAKTIHVVYHNGIEVGRWVVSTEITKPKQNKIVTSGSITGRANFGYYSGMVTSFYKGMTGRYLLVTNLDNGKQVKVKIIGSGPFNGPLMDMGTEPFQAIGGSIATGYLPRVSVQLVD